MIVGIWAQTKVETTYRRWLRVGSRSGITGSQAAAVVMEEAGIRDVKITEIPGHLSDHYNPVTKTLALSRENYHGRSLAALGVAAHEAGHAIQHKQAYMPLKFRAFLIPVTNIASQILPFVIIGGFFLGMFGLIKLGVACYLVLTVFQIVTLPVEFDASRRAKRQLVKLGILGKDEAKGVEDTLDAAAWTYVAAFIASLANLLYFFILSRRD